MNSVVIIRTVPLATLKHFEKDPRFGITTAMNGDSFIPLEEKALLGCVIASNRNPSYQILTIALTRVYNSEVIEDKSNILGLRSYGIVSKSLPRGEPRLWVGLCSSLQEDPLNFVRYVKTYPQN